MTKFRQLSQNPLVILFLLFNFIYVNANRTEIVVEQIKSKHLQKSGEEIFKGLFFLQNDITENIESLKNLKTQIENSKNGEQSLTHLTNLSNESTAYIKEKYPEFFDKLQKAMYSGNLYEIDNYMKQSVILVEQAGLASDKYSGLFTFSNIIKNNEQLKNQIVKLDLSNPHDSQVLKDILKEYSMKKNFTQMCAVAGAFCVFYAIAAAVSIAVAAYSVVTKMAYIDILDYANIEPSKQLNKDLLVNQIDDYFRS